MIEIQQEQERKVKCLLVGAPDKKNGNPEPKEDYIWIEKK